VVKLGVRRSRHYLKIVFGIILSVLVFVVDAFVLFKLSTNHLFCNKDVLFNVLGANKNSYVAIAINVPSAFPKVVSRSFARANSNAVSMLVCYLTRLTAIAGISSFYLTRPRKKASSAYETSSGNVSVFRASWLDRIVFSHCHYSSDGVVRGPSDVSASSGFAILTSKAGL
jgi:hypothetical protein